ncbi:conserved hypothetical protein [Rubrobacter xylanophilus DSM 9941]|uniref:Cytosolic protein n=1 Tax=Rubrobacter xylanophilus (strain DSM 9941 / JCM 11954 / NBRC 16129 / PRD-1) TaxID=266117 RepID=Q1AZJ8_RUBXD|nr:DUF6282 family protein [Rubrobacter xylanophilus]ABG03180.1 conserved hypothetical protein [Rubrobacter xylanophilus DSM 9941]
MCSGAGSSGASPSARARELVRGAYDHHVHLGPDVMQRRIDDLGLARRFRELGLSGFTLKSHYVPTAERASVVRAAEGVEVFGAIALNAAVGGMNALAVEIAAREGARFVWMPTVSAANEAEILSRSDGGGRKLPFWARLQRELEEQGISTEPVRVVDGTGAVLPETREVLRVVAAHDLVLATGHLSRDEIFAVVEAAREEGVRRIVITHPEFPSQDLSADDQASLVEQGALLERCFAPAYGGKVSWEKMFENIRATGPENSFLSTDLGQPANPPVEDGIALMAERLLEAGFSEEEVRVMAVENTRRLAQGVLV